VRNRPTRDTSHGRPPSAEGICTQRLTTGVNSLNNENPPSASVRGKVQEVLPGQNLVKINLGSDMGVNENNTLEVFRLQPKAEYLGRLRIVEAHHRVAAAAGPARAAPSALPEGR